MEKRINHPEMRNVSAEEEPIPAVARHNMHEKGMTLIELLLYIALTAAMLLTLTFALKTVLQARIKNQVMTEVEQQGQFALHAITQAIRNAQNITSPTTGASASSLTLDVVNASEDPTVFNTSSGTIYMTQGTGSAIPLTNSRVTAHSLTFYNLSRANTFGNIRIILTLSYVNTSGRNEYTYSKTFYASASLRQ